MVKDTNAAAVDPGKHVTSGLLSSAVQHLVGAVSERVVSSAGRRVGEVTQRLTDYAEKGGGPGLASAVTGVQKKVVKSALTAGVAGGKKKITQKIKQALGGGGGGGKKIKITNIVEEIDVGVPAQVAYDQWTRFTDFPSFMKKVENVEQESDEKVNWKAQIFWSHRSWGSTIIEQVPDRRIVWRSRGDKGYVDGAVTFHEVGPELTRIVLILEYHPQGMFERTGNLWRAQGRRARLELKLFARHVMTQTILHPDAVQGWRGEIHDGRVVKDQEAALAEERQGTPQAPKQRTEESGGQQQPAARAEEADDSGGQRQPGAEAEEAEASGEEKKPAAEAEQQPAARAEEADEEQQSRSRSLRGEPLRRLSRAAGESENRE